MIMASVAAPQMRNQIKQHLPSILMIISEITAMLMIFLMVSMMGTAQITIMKMIQYVGM